MWLGFHLETWTWLTRPPGQVPGPIIVYLEIYWVYLEIYENLISHNPSRISRDIRVWAKLWHPSWAQFMTFLSCLNMCSSGTLPYRYRGFTRYRLCHGVSRYHWHDPSRGFLLTRSWYRDIMMSHVTRYRVPKSGTHPISGHHVTSHWYRNPHTWYQDQYRVQPVPKAYRKHLESV